MNFSAAANEFANWISSHPGHAAIWVAIGAAGAGLSAMKYREGRDDRRKIEESDARLPDVKPVKLPPLSNSGPR